MQRRYPSDSDTNEPAVGEGAAASRRAFLLMSLGLLAAGCKTGTTGRVAELPGPIWPDRADSLPDADPVQPANLPDQARTTQLPSGVRSRTEWSGGRPVPSLMNRMLPVRYITVHHDGMTPYFGETQASATERLELIRRSHRNKNWGDIGYHFIIDRSGTIWEGRPLMYQGAHVKDHNEGNIGVMCLGNFELQSPSVAQLESLNQYLSRLMHTFRTPLQNVKTHQEWAKTACPGRTLQRHMVTVRRNHMIG